MTQQVTISIPHPLYQRMQHLASTQNQPIDDLLEIAISLAETALIPDAAQAAAMRREEAAYEAMHAELMAKHWDEYVAVYQGEVIDHDSDQGDLVRRLDQTHPDAVVLVKKVTAESAPVLRILSSQAARSTPGS